jgi:hypothetical protein
VEKAKRAPSGSDTRERRASHGPIEAFAHKPRSALPKTRMRFSAEVDYALGILRRIRGQKQFFSVEEVRNLINGKFLLELTGQDDAQIAAILSNQNDVRPSAKSGKNWKFC